MAEGGKLSFSCDPGNKKTSPVNKRGCQLAQNKAFECEICYKPGRAAGRDVDMDKGRSRL